MNNNSACQFIETDSCNGLLLDENSVPIQVTHLNPCLRHFVVLSMKA
jgi:hypothetical protein